MDDQSSYSTAASIDGSEESEAGEARAIVQDLQEFRSLERDGDGTVVGARDFRRVKKYDANKDGKVTAEEFLAGRARERAQVRFQELDRAGTGRLKVDAAQGGALGRYDANGDGMVDQEEFTSGRLADTNELRDGLEFEQLKPEHASGTRRLPTKFRREEGQTREEFIQGRAAERQMAALKDQVERHIARLRSDGESS